MYAGNEIGEDPWGLLGRQFGDYTILGFRRRTELHAHSGLSRLFDEYFAQGWDNETVIAQFTSRIKVHTSGGTINYSLFNVSEGGSEDLKKLAISFGNISGLVDVDLECLEQTLHYGRFLRDSYGHVIPYQVDGLSYPLDDGDAVNLMVAVAEAVADLHDHDLMHGFLHPNVIKGSVDGEGSIGGIRITGWQPGILEEDLTNEIHAPMSAAAYHYLDPQFGQDTDVDLKAADVYGLAAMLSLCMGGTLAPLQTGMVSLQKLKMNGLRPDYGPEMDVSRNTKLLRKFIEQVLIPDPDVRIGAREFADTIQDLKPPQD